MENPVYSVDDIFSETEWNANKNPANVLSVKIKGNFGENSIEKLKIFNKNIQKVYIFLNDGNIEKILAILREILDNNNIGYNRDKIECPLCTRKNLQEE